MKLLVVAAVLTAPLCLAGNALACGYGLLDPDVELYCSGDPLRSQQAWARLMRRGPQAARAAQSYYRMAQRSDQWTRTYLDQLERGEHAGLSAEQAAKEVVRMREFLKFNSQRLNRLRVLLVHVSGDLLTGEPWGASRLSVA